MMKRNLKRVSTLGKKRKGYKRLYSNLIMTKEEERKKIVEAIKSSDFEKSCEDAGFSVCSTAEESKTKKRANVQVILIYNNIQF